jgi:hypothetical protein
MNCLRTFLALTLIVPTYLAAQDGRAFKLGTFQDANHVYVGLVLDDRLVVDISLANEALAGAKPPIPSFMRGVINRYDELRPRLGDIADAAASSGTQPPYVTDVGSVKILAPITPSVIYNAASNYSLHAAEMARRAAGGAEPAAVPAPDPIPGIWERTPGDTRQNPYIFLKAGSTIIADGEEIRIPPKRGELDWECELAVVIGQLRAPGAFYRSKGVRRGSSGAEADVDVERPAHAGLQYRQHDARHL